MPGILPLLVSYAALIAIKPSGAGECPPPVQVAQALEARLPGALVPYSEDAGPDVFLLSLDLDGAGMPLILLEDQSGRQRLRRILPTSPAPAERDCAALAETVALIVERFLAEITFREPSVVAEEAPTARGPRRWELGLAAGWRPSEARLAHWHLGLGLGRRFRSIGVGLMAGAANPAQRHWPGGGTGTLWRFPLELTVRWSFRAGRGELQTGVSGSADLIWLSARAGPMRQSERRWVPSAGLEAGYRQPLGGRFFTRAVIGLGTTFTRYEFVTPSGGGIAFETERAYANLRVELGISFW